MKLTDILKQILLEADRCKRIADRKYDKPSAYKSGAIVRCRKGNIWKGLKETIEQIDIKADTFIKRIPFLKQFRNYSDDKQIFLQKVDYNENKKIMLGDDLINFKQVNTSIEFIYYKNKIHDNYFFNFILDFRLHLMPPEDLNDLEKRVLIIANNLNNKKYSYNKEIRSKDNNLSKEEFDKVINELNGKFFQIEEYINSSIFDIKNPLNEAKKETLRTWFKRKGAPGKEGGWVDCNTCRKVDGKTKCKACGRKKGEKRTKYPSCRPTPSQCKDPGKGKKWGKTK